MIEIQQFELILYQQSFVNDLAQTIYKVTELRRKTNSFTSTRYKNSLIADFLRDSSNLAVGSSTLVRRK